MPVSVRPADSDDDAFLYNLYCSTRSDEMAAWDLDATQKEAILKMQFNAQRQSYRMQFPEAEHNIIVVDGKPVGRIITLRAAEAIRVVDISIVPEHRGAGTGTFLIKQLFDEARERGKPVRLQVEKTNRAARLYERLGFVRTSDSSFFITMEWRAGARP